MPRLPAGFEFLQGAFIGATFFLSLEESFEGHGKAIGEQPIRLQC